MDPSDDTEHIYIRILKFIKPPSTPLPGLQQGQFIRVGTHYVTIPHKCLGESLVNVLRHNRY